MFTSTADLSVGQILMLDDDRFNAILAPKGETLLALDASPYRGYKDMVQCLVPHPQGTNIPDLSGGVVVGTCGDRHVDVLFLWRSEDAEDYGQIVAGLVRGVNVKRLALPLGLTRLPGEPALR